MATESLVFLTSKTTFDQVVVIGTGKKANKKCAFIRRTEFKLVLAIVPPCSLRILSNILTNLADLS